MPHDAAEESLTRKVQAACDYYQSDEQRPHLIWYYDQLMSRLKISDLDTCELAAMIAILVDAHARKLSAADGPESPGGVLIPVLGSFLERRLHIINN